MLRYQLCLTACLRLRALALPAAGLLIVLTFGLLRLNAQDTPPLEPGKPIERELKGGETHQYAVMLAAGQYLRVEVEQLGIDVLVTFLAPDKARLFEFGANEAPTGTETVCLVAEQAGIYYLQVRANSEQAEPARYEVRVTELREATANDKERFAAQKYFAEASQLMGSQSLDAFRKAVPILEAALALAQTAGDQHLEATILFALGDNYRAFHDQPKAIEHLNRALQFSRALGDQLEQARTLFKLGFCHTEIGQNLQARECLQQALPLYREVGDKSGEGRALYMMAESYARESPKMSIDYYQQAEPLLRVTGDTRYLIDALYSMGLSWLQLGEPQKAFEVLFQALPLAERYPLKDSKANTLDNLSKVHQAVGEYQKALDAQYEALALRQSIGEDEGAANSYRYLGSIYLDLGETQRAVEFLQQSVKMRQSIGYHFRALMSQSELGKAWYLLGQYQTALDYFLSILPLTRQYNDKFSEARVLEGLGLIYQALGEYKKALEFYEQALLVNRAIPWRAGEVQVMLASGHTYASLHNYAKAAELYLQALTLARQLNYSHVEAAALSGLARVELNQGNLSAARTKLEAALQIVESVRSRVASPTLRASFLATQHSSYESYVALLMQLHRQDPAAGHAAGALQIAERARARSLTESLTEAPANIREGVAPALLARERELRQKISSKSSAQNRAATQTEEQAATFSREISELTAELEQVEAQIRAASPRYAALTQPPPLSLATIQQDVVADAETLLLEYALGEERSFLWAVTKDSLSSYELPPRAAIERAARRGYELLTARSQFNKFEEETARRARLAKADAGFASAAAELSKLILAPAAAQLGKKRLLIVADGALQYVPFAALPECGMRNAECGMNAPIRNQPLLVNHELVSLPSAATLAVLRRELAGRPPAPQTVAVLGDPVFDKQDERVRAAVAKTNTPAAEPTRKPAVWLNELERSARDVNDAERAGFDRLPATRAEAQAAVKFAPAGTSRLALDFAANQNTATSGELSQYRYVHFATHGLLNNEHPELSGLVLSLVDEAGRETDGFLPLLEIYNLKLPAELVVLSACKTGIGREIKGEGLMSLTRGFMYAGAARTLVSLWGVNDRSTTALMTQFYQGILQDKLAPAAALRKAQLALRQDARWAAPYYWAAFTLYGEPR